jgi:hypothetical protein
MSPIPHLGTLGQKISPLFLWEFVSAIGLSLAYFFRPTSDPRPGN